jgi:DNA invertase Pin-like site-specific DNA recombinase
LFHLRASGRHSHDPARSIGDLQDIVRTIRSKGAKLKVTEQPIDTGTGTAAGKCFLDMLGWACSPSSRPTLPAARC